MCLAGDRRNVVVEDVPLTDGSKPPEMLPKHFPMVSSSKDWIRDTNGAADTRQTRRVLTSRTGTNNPKSIGGEGVVGGFEREWHSACAVDQPIVPQCFNVTNHSWFTIPQESPHSVKPEVFGRHVTLHAGVFRPEQTDKQLRVPPHSAHSSHAARFVGLGPDLLPLVSSN